jgi:alpha-methylacyl-CoA racemase
MGALTGVKVIEFAAIGPAPFCGMMLSDMGADVIRVDRKTIASAAGDDGGFLARSRAGTTHRGKRSVALDLKSPQGVAAALQLIATADVLIEGFRPGVMERLGLGPDACLDRNPRIVYGRVTGWGQDGPLAHTAGHDINYIALAGVLGCIGPSGAPPAPPLNLIGDFGGGAMMLAFGIVCALLETRRSGRGQVVDAAMVDGAALLMANIYARKSLGVWPNPRGANALDGGAHWYGCYECADGKYIAVGCVEPQFYAILLQKCGITDPDMASQWQADRWPELRERLAATIKTRTRDAWCHVFLDSDACVAPVLDLDEAPQHAHNVARQIFLECDGVVQPRPAPRLSRTPAAIQGDAPFAGEHTDEVLAEVGMSSEAIKALRKIGAIA